MKDQWHDADRALDTAESDAAAEAAMEAETVAESVTLVPGVVSPVGFEVVAVVDGCFTVVKHSVVAFVCDEEK